MECMIRHIWSLDYYALDFPKNTYHFYERKHAVRALRKYLKSGKTFFKLKP